MKKSVLVACVLCLASAGGPALARGFDVADPFAPPPLAGDILSEAVGETPALPGIGSDETTKVLETTEDTPFASFAAMVIYENSIGIGTFVADDAQRRSKWDMMWSIRPGVYLFKKFLLVQARIDLNQPIIDNADAETTENNQFTITDTFITFLMPNIYTEPVTGIRFGAWFDFLFPTALESRHANKLLTIRPGVTIGRTFGPVDIAYQFRFSKNFHSSTNPELGYDPVTGGAPDPYAGSLGGLRDFDNAVGVSSDFSIMNRLTVTYEFVKDFYAALDFVIFNSWSYDTASDIDCVALGLAAGCDLHSDYAQPGRGQSDLTSLTLEVGYAPLKYLTLALGVTTYQPPQRDDNSGFRFPLNFSDASRNFTTVYLDVIGTY